MHTMTKRQGKSGTIDVKALLAEDEEFLQALVRTALQEVLEAEMTEAVGAEKGERTARGFCLTLRAPPSLKQRREAKGLEDAPIVGFPTARQDAGTDDGEDAAEIGQHKQGHGYELPVSGGSRREGHGNPVHAVA
jgi:hypothetical protein